MAALVSDRWHSRGKAQLYCDVNELINRYARAVDRKDWALLSSTYHHDAIDDHGSSVGSAQELIATLEERHKDIVDVMHLNGNVLILEVDEERREVLTETYCVGWQRLAPQADHIPALYDSPLISSSAKSRLCAVGNRYLDLISERGGELRFSYRKVVYEWIHVSEYPLVPPFAATWSKGVRTREDPSFASLEEVRREVERLQR